MFSVQCHHERWTINKLAVNEVNLPKGNKAESRVLFKMSACVRGVRPAVLCFTAGFLGKRTNKKSSHASIPVRGSLKLCVSSALNYLLCKSDVMIKSEGKRFGPTLLASCRHYVYIVKQSDNSTQSVKYLQCFSSPVPHELSVFVRFTCREGWVSMDVLFSQHPAVSFLHVIVNTSVLGVFLKLFEH